MSRYARSLAWRFLGLSGLLACGAVLLVSIGESLLVGRRSLGAGAGLADLLHYQALKAPHWFGLFLPLAMVVAAFAVLGLAALRNEIAALQSFGRSPLSATRSMALAALALAAAGAGNQLWIAPELLWRARGRLRAPGTQPGEAAAHWRGPTGERWIVAAWDAAAGRGGPCQSFRFREANAGRPELAQWTEAREAIYKDDGWELVDGRVLARVEEGWRGTSFARWSPAGMTPAPAAALAAALRLPRGDPDALHARVRVAEEWTLGDLLRRGRQARSDIEQRLLRAVLHFRAALVVAPLLVALATLPLGLYLEAGRTWRPLGWLVFACWAMYLLLTLGIGTVVRGLDPLLLPWAPLLLAAAAGLWRGARGPCL